MSPSIQISLGEVALALVLVAVAVAASLWERADLEGDIGIAVVRSFIQLTAIGYVIKFLFDQDSIALVLVVVAVMVVLAAWTAQRRAKKVPNAFWPLLLALAVAAGATLGVVTALGIFEPKPQYLIPVAGIVIGNAMTSAAVALNRLADDVHGSRNEIEATLSLGATSAQASRPIMRRALRSGLIPLLDQTKTTGLITFPGIMVGMLLGGADPADAVRLQLIILWTLLGAVSLSALLAMSLSYRRFFTPDHQLRE
jgi:putative ABC transport system permease protein